MPGSRSNKAAADLFDPELVEVDGAWFLKSKFDKAVYDEWVETGLKSAAIQEQMNMISISWLVQDRELCVSEIERLIGVVTRVWRKTLQVDGIMFSSNVVDHQFSYFSFYQGKEQLE
jgi:hypothetical protein